MLIETTDLVLFCSISRQTNSCVSFHFLGLNLYNEDFLDYTNKDFDLIVGNPPYVRIHNLDNSMREKIKNYEFSTGNTDLYVIFFEKCIKILNESGRLIFITPNSYIKNTSQKTFRKYLCENKLIEKIIDFGSNKVFKNADTYTAITYLNKVNNKDFFIYEKSDMEKTNSLTNILFNTSDWTLNKNTKNKLGNICKVQYGFATNADKIFIKDNFNDLEKEILRDIVKGSKIDTTNVQKIIFPYKKKDEKYIPFTEQELKEKFPKAYKYLLEHKTELESRSLESNTSWFEFARSQSIQSVDDEKLVIKHVLNENSENVTYKIIPKGMCVYSGLYITATDLNSVKEVISTKDFCKYLKENGKDLSGGYKSFNTKLIKNYNY